jgi:uncharacterized protein DUF4333
MRSAGSALLFGVRAQAVGLIAIALAAGAGGCGSSRPKILDTERVERAIERSVLEKRHLRTRVSCPSGIERKKGLVFRCIATYKGGRTPFVVKQDDDKGSVHYRGVRK